VLFFSIVLLFFATVLALLLLWARALLVRAVAVALLVLFLFSWPQGAQIETVLGNPFIKTLID